MFPSSLTLYLLTVKSILSTSQKKIGFDAIMKQEKIIIVPSTNM